MAKEHKKIIFVFVAFGLFLVGVLLSNNYISKQIDENKDVISVSNKANIDKNNSSRQSSYARKPITINPKNDPLAPRKIVKAKIKKKSTSPKKVYEPSTNKSPILIQ